MSSRMQQISVREIMIADQSMQQPTIITAWTDLASEGCAQLAEKIPEMPVVGFTNLKTAKHKGFSLTATSSTLIKMDPKGDRVETLRTWAKNNKHMLTDWTQRIEQARDAEREPQCITIAQLRAKRAVNVLQEDRFKMAITIPGLAADCVKFFFGCSKCGRPVEGEAGDIFKCGSCDKTGCEAVPRMTVTFDVVDNTGVINFTAFAAEADKLMGKTAKELHSMSDVEQAEFYVQKAEIMQGQSFVIVTGPTYALTLNNVLKWTLKSIELA